MERHRREVLAWITILLFLCYCSQVFTPLRLNGDAIVLLSMGESAAQGRGLLDDGLPTVFPPAYPTLLSWLLRFGAASSGTIVGCNVLFLALGMLALRSLLLQSFTQSGEACQVIVILSLLSFAVVKHFPIPLTDIPFFGIATCCVAVTTHVAKRELGGRKFVQGTLLSWGLALLAILIRRNGVALVPMLLWMLFLSRTGFAARFHGVAKRSRVAAAVVSLAAGTAVVWAVSKTSTLRDFWGIVRGEDLLRLAFKVVNYRLTELGELAINLPKSRLPGFSEVLLPLVGAMVLVMVIGGFRVLRREGRGGAEAVDVFVGSYIAILFVWPYYDARFWVPVLPLLMAYAGLFATRALAPLGRFPRTIFLAGVTLFVLFGLLSLGYSARITFAGPKFPDRYGEGSLRPTYCAALNSCGSTFDWRDVKPKELHLLQTYR